MIVAGVMSGTSADGVDVALVRVEGREFNLRFELLGNHHLPYPKPVRETILRTMNARQASLADLSRLNFRLGELYAEAVSTAQNGYRIKTDQLGIMARVVCTEYVHNLHQTCVGWRAWHLHRGATTPSRRGRRGVTGGVASEGRV